MPRYQNHEKSGQSIPLERIAIFPLDGDQWISLAEVFSAGIAFSSIALITGSSQIRDNGRTSPAVGFDVINDGAQTIEQRGISSTPVGMVVRQRSDTAFSSDQVR